MIKPQDTLLGRFRVEKLLGQGGMGTVVAARHIELDELFAIKLLRPELLQKEAFASRFLHEARAAARLRSPHIARVYDVGKLEDGVPYMVMEYLEGCDLRRLLKRHGAVPLVHTARLMLQACDALAEAHAAGIIHRDLKLDNLFLTHRRGAPCLKVLDFGISKNAHVNQGLTRSGVLMGSPLYMSPEQMKNARDVDPRADVWAMGVSFYELLTAATPFHGEVLVELLFHVLTHQPSAPSTLCAELPQDVDELILRCLAKDPEERFADIESLARAIEPFASTDEWPEAYVQIADECAEELDLPPANESYESDVLSKPDPSEQSVVSLELSTVANRLNARLRHDEATLPAEGADSQGQRPIALLSQRGDGAGEDLPRAPGVRTRPEADTGDLDALRVFLCCRQDISADLDVASLLHHQLSMAGARPFLSSKNLKGAHRWVESVFAALNECDVFLLLLSDEAMVSELVAAELAMARQIQQSNPDRPKLLSVRLRGCIGDVTLPSSFDTLDSTDWRGPGDTEEVVRAILRAAEVPSRAAQPPASTKRRVAPSLHEIISLELPGGVVRTNSRFYIERHETEQRCCHEITKPGALLRIKGPQRVGKTSFMLRILDHARDQGMRVAHVDLQLLDTRQLSNLKRFLRWLCAIITRRLGLPHVKDEWDEVFGPKDNCTAYFEDHLLGNGPLVVAINHLDKLFDAPNIAEEFLILLRAWHEMSKSQELWSELRLVLAYSTEMYLPMDINHSPFNVGLAVPLGDWSADTVLALARRHDLDWTGREVDALMSLLGGHPHLVRLALYHIRDQGIRLDEALARAATDDGLFADHLKHLLWQLQKQPELGRAAARVMQADAPVHLATEHAFKLISLGVVRPTDKGVVAGRALYRAYLSTRLTNEDEARIR